MTLVSNLFLPCYPGGKKSFGGRTPKVVDDDVEAAVTSFANKRFCEILIGLPEVDSRVGSEVVKGIQYLFVPSDRNHPPSAEELGRLYGKLACDSGCTED